MPCKKMSKDVSISTFTIQYLMESGQGLTSNNFFPFWKHFTRKCSDLFVCVINNLIQASHKLTL